MTPIHLPDINQPPFDLRLQDDASNNNNNGKAKKVNIVPQIKISKDVTDFDMPPLETMSPFDAVMPLYPDDNVFFSGAISTANSGAKNKQNKKLKRVLSAPKAPHEKDHRTRRQSFGNLLKSTFKKTGIGVDDTDNDSNASSVGSSWSLSFFKRGRSKSENVPIGVIEHPHPTYAGIRSIHRGSQTDKLRAQAGQEYLSSSSPSFWHEGCKGQQSVATQTPPCAQKRLSPSSPKSFSEIDSSYPNMMSFQGTKQRTKIRTNPRLGSPPYN